MRLIMTYMIFMLIPFLYIEIRASQSRISHFRFFVPVTLIQGQGQPKVKFHLIFDYFSHLLNFVRIEQKFGKN